MGCNSSCTGPESPPIEAACNEALRGAWALAENVTQAEAEQACRVGCVACANCAYVSVSFEQRECSWYSACDTSKLVKGAHGSTFQTHFVRELSRDSETSHESHAAEWRRHRMLGSKRIGGAPEQGPRIWVINTSVHECHNSRKGKDLFEEKLPALFRSGFCVRLRLQTPTSSTTPRASLTPTFGSENEILDDCVRWSPGSCARWKLRRAPPSSARPSL